MVQLRSGKKTQSVAHTTRGQRRDRSAINLEHSISGEKKVDAKNERQQPRNRRTPKKAAQPRAQHGHQKQSREKPRGTPEKTVGTKRREAMIQVSERNKRSGQASSSNSREADNNVHTPKTSFLKSGAGEIRRMRLSEEKRQARKVKENKEISCVSITADGYDGDEFVSPDREASEVKTEDIADKVQSLSVEASRQTAVHGLLNSVEGEEVMYGKSKAVLTSKRDWIENGETQSAENDGSNDESEEWSSECDVESRCSLPSSVCAALERCSTSRNEKGESNRAKQREPGAVRVWWEADDEVEGGVQVIDDSDAVQVYMRDV